MSRVFDGVNDAVTSPAVDLSGVSHCSIFMWLYWNAYANDDELAFEFTTNYNTQTGGIIFDPNSSFVPGTIDIGYKDGANTLLQHYARTDMSAAAWHAVGFDLERSNGTAQMFVDGAAKTPTSTTGSGNATNFGNSNFYLMSRAASTLWAAGRMAHFAVWNVRLNSAEFSALSKVAPWKVRPGSLVLYLPLIGTGSPEPEMTGKGTATVAGSPATATDEPPVGVFVPASRVAELTPAAAAPTTDSATVYLDITASSVESAQYVDSATAYVDLQASGSDVYTFGGSTDSATVYLDLRTSTTLELGSSTVETAEVFIDADCFVTDNVGIEGEAYPRFRSEPRERFVADVKERFTARVYRSGVPC